MNVPREFVVPKNTDVIFVADLFEEDYIGGAELTTEAIYTKSPGHRVFKLHSSSLTPELVEANKDKYWVLFNWTGAPKPALAALVYLSCRYSIVEYDYKICKYRSLDLHLLKEGKDCDCAPPATRLSNFAIILSQCARSVFYMSESQRSICHGLICSHVGSNLVLPRHHDFADFILSSVWKDKDLDFIEELAKKRRESKVQDKWVVLSGGSWIKNQEATEKYCQSKGIPYELVGNLPYQDFLIKMARYKGLVFRPAGHDTCPRLVVEAKLLGLELDLNENVQHKNEWWFDTPDNEETMKYLRSNVDVFWKNILFHCPIDSASAPCWPC